MRLKWEVNSGVLSVLLDYERPPKLLQLKVVPTRLNSIKSECVTSPQHQITLRNGPDVTRFTLQALTPRSSLHEVVN